MKTLTKLALVSAMAVSSSAFALETLDDSALSQTTGQDGITIKLDAQSDGTIFGADNIVVHDNDGIGAAGYGITTPGAGAIVLGKDGTGAGVGFSIKGAVGDAVTIKVDADANGTDPVLNVNIGLPTSLTIHTGDIYVAKSNGINATGAQFANEAKVLSDVVVGLGGAQMNIQLGNAPQGAMIALGGNVTGGVNISNFELADNSVSGGGVIHLDTINVRDAGGANLSLGTNISATTDGLSIIRTAGDVDVRLTGVQLGTADVGHQIGDVALLGMKVPNMTISGH
ncbi:MAG: hypothetical protein EOO69_01575 [Moraxellaceae bacterium]|nr:MAG: hypothetical protein EOO69_01575 [Moraxellaceae bacterium]